MIHRPAQRTTGKRAGSTVIEVVGSYSVYVSQPSPVTAFTSKEGGLSNQSGSGSSETPPRPGAGSRVPECAEIGGFQHPLRRTLPGGR